MKKYTILLILLLSFTYVKAQTILINGTTVSVSQDVTFPFWLDSMSTIEIGSQVVSISALEFNIIPTTNGNSLVFVQTKIITSQETVPNGKTWKLEGVLLDSTATSTSGGETIVSGGEKAVALSEQSASTMNMGEAMLYCDSLAEGGYDNWVVPTLEEIMFVAGGGGVVPGTRNNDYLWTGSKDGSTWYRWNSIRLSNGTTSNTEVGPHRLRCVRHESVSVSSSSSSSTQNQLQIGDYHEGGVIFYLDSTNQHGLVCHVNNITNTYWFCNDLIGCNGTAIGTGAQNTAIFQNYCIANGACWVCNAGGLFYSLELISTTYSDWFVPSIDELQQIFIYKSLINKCSLENGGDSFKDASYWSSTEFDVDDSWQVDFSTGGGGMVVGKSHSNFFRAVRAF